ncbi:CoA transferase [Salinadaptatus halalkaliphilus]|uniref:CoA transferase n=1 Tax=Salinadaptatus halalkaliphilus TaxID=2419781 RepID=A0A4S3TQV6_9EURY|nr:CaiB/BaiF CoA-transferase family protein [Salinadaptatus halalkaliphilus]THE66010.1 CoA transferase [Salinadaptatus halalkaliphilus]
MHAFTDVDVLDLTQSVAGPLSTQFLGMQGANVVKVEPPGGDKFRDLIDGAMFASANLGGKQSLCLDLKTEDGQAIAHELAANADVVVESFRPGVLERFELDYESVRADNDDVIYCSITGYGQDGPRSGWAAYDPLVQAISGLMATVSPSDDRSIRIGASLIDYGTGLNAAFLVSSALRERDRTGEGKHIDVSLFDTAVWYMGYWIAHYSATGEYPDEAGYEFGGSAPNGGFNTAGNEEIYLTVVDDDFFQRLCRAIDREDLATDDRFRHKAQRWDNRSALRAILDEEFEDWGRDELIDALTDAGVTAAPIKTIDELVDGDPQVNARELLTDTYNLHRDVEVTTAAPPFRLDGDRPDIGNRPPTCGEHTRSVLADLGYDAEQIDQLLERGAVRE